MAKYGLTTDFLKSQIDNVTFNRFGETGIQCVLTLLNGYTVTGESNCIDPAIFDQSIGETIAYENAFDKLWVILGYNEKQRWYEETVLTWVDRVKLELDDLVKKRTKLVKMLLKGKPDYISQEEWERLNKQAQVMSEYGSILMERLVAADNSQKAQVGKNNEWQKFKKKPVVIKAWQNTPENRLKDIPEEIKALSFRIMPNDEIVHVIDTLEGQMTASQGDWIIQGVNGELYPCKPDIFEKTYEQCDE